MTDEHESRLNARWPLGHPHGCSLLHSEDEHTALETYIELRRQCARDLGPERRKPESYLDAGYRSDREPTLLGLLAVVFNRPGMHFGNGNVDNGWALVSGYLAAERDHGIASETATLMADFQHWVDERYPFGRGLPWFRVFRLLRGPGQEMDRFKEHLDLFLSNAPSDAPDPTMQKMMAAIVRHTKRGEPS
jgi:hypothetical protein